MIVENPDIGLFVDRIQQTLLDFSPRRIVIMEDASFGVAPFSAQIQFPMAILEDSFVELYADPHQFPSGPRTCVIVNGTIVVENSTHTGALPGKVLRRDRTGAVG